MFIIININYEIEMGCVIYLYIYKNNLFMYLIEFSFKLTNELI